LQETHCINTIESKWRKEWGGNNRTKVQKGVAVLFKEGFKYNVNVNIIDQNGRYLQCEFKIDTDEIFRITNVYVPNIPSDRKRFLEELNIDNDEHILNLVVGDFNCTLNTNLDRKPIPLRDDIGKNEFENFIQKFGLDDIYRKRNPKTKRYTFKRVNSHSQIDYILSIGECNSPFLKNNGAEATKGPRPIVFKEWRDTRTFSNIKSTHCTSFIVLIVNLITKTNLCIVSKVQSIKLY
jgi:exonuclease III